MDLTTWHKDAKPSTYYATHNDKRIATARKEGTSWTGTVVGLGFSFGGRRLADVKELAQRHVERIYGSGEWTLFPARDLKPGMVVGRDTWKDGDREIVSVEVDTEAQTVDVELSSESSRELGLTLDDTYAVDTMIRVRRSSLIPKTDADEETEQGQESEADTSSDMAPETASCGLRRSGWERPGPGARRLPCTLPTGHTQPHRDAFRRSFTRSEADAPATDTAVTVAPEVGQVIDLRPFTAIVDMIASTGVLISPPASEDLTLSEGGASLHDSLRADALRRLLPHGVEALEGEDGGLSLEGVTADGRQVFSLYVTDSITTEPDFEEVACSIEALRQAAGLDRLTE